MLIGRVGRALLLVQRLAIWFRSNCLSRRHMFRESLRIPRYRQPRAVVATNGRHIDGMMARKSHRLSTFRARCLATDRGHESNAQAVPRDALLVEPVLVAEFLLQISLFAPHHADVENEYARNNQQHQPIEREHQSKPEHHQRSTAVQGIARPAEDTFGGERGCWTQWAHIGAKSRQHAPAGRGQQDTGKDHSNTCCNPASLANRRESTYRRQPLQEASESNGRGENDGREDDDVGMI